MYRDEIAKQVDETSCVAVQADETTDVSCKSQMVVVLPYILPCNTVTERFLEFVEVKDKTGVGLCNSFQVVLEPLKLREKLIAQTYDGAAVMSGNVRGVQKADGGDLTLPTCSVCSLLRPPTEPDVTAAVFS